MHVIVKLRFIDKLRFIVISCRILRVLSTDDAQKRQTALYRQNARYHQTALYRQNALFRHYAS